MMLIVDQSTRAREHVALRSMFAARKRVFVDILKWDLPVLAGCFEVDRRDGPGATYLIVAGPDGEHRASARVLREPSAALGPFGDRIYEPPMKGSVAEETHACLSPDFAADDRRRARDQLLYGLVDHALARRIGRFVGAVPQPWAPKIQNMGWTCRHLGAVHAGCGPDMMAIAVDVDAATPAKLARAGIARPTVAGRAVS